MARRQSEEGFALITALILLSVVLGLGLALLGFGDSQQRAALVAQGSETAYSVAEAALNAQVFELSQRWASTGSPMPAGGCTSANAASTAGCPDPANLNTVYGQQGPTTCPSGVPTGTQTDAWGAPAGTRWATYVRDDTGGGYFSSASEAGAPADDANGNGTVWVRAIGVADCRLISVVTKVSLQYLPVTFPQVALSANAFSVGNNGKKTMIDTQGSASQPGAVSTRCAGVSANCASYDTSKGQVSPDTCNRSSSAPNGCSGPPQPSPALSSSQLAQLKAAAIANGSYYAGCPSTATLAQLSGNPTYIEGSANCNLSFNGNDAANSSASPGFLVLVSGTLSLGGTTNFYGAVYALNAQGSSANVVSTQGNAMITGEVVVDGTGQVAIDSSSLNLTYDPRSAQNIRGLAGTAATPNTFRVLPTNQ